MTVVGVLFCMADPDMPGPQTSLASDTCSTLWTNGPGTLILEPHAHSQVCSSALAWQCVKGTLEPAPWGDQECSWDCELASEQQVKRLRAVT